MTVTVRKLEKTCPECGAETDVVYVKGVGQHHSGSDAWKNVAEILVDKPYCNVEKRTHPEDSTEVYANVCTECGTPQDNQTIHEAVFSNVASLGSWDAALENYEVVDTIDLPVDS